MRGETHSAICECPIMREQRACSTPVRAISDLPPHRIQDLRILDFEIHQHERILRAPAFERSQYEFTRDTTEQRIGMAKPVPGEWLAVQNLRCLPGDWAAI